MRYSLITVALLASITGACIGGDSTEVQAVTATTTTTTIPATTTTMPVAELQPHEVADQLFQAELDGDFAVWLAVHADDATFTNALDYSWPKSDYYEPADWVTDDFNGDGVLSLADWDEWRSSLAAATGITNTWECVTVSEDGAECTSTYQDALTEAGGGAPRVKKWRYRVADNKIVEAVWLTDPDEYADSAKATETMLGKYDRWMHQNHREQWDELFHEPWGDRLFVLLPETIPVHEQLMAEFLGPYSVAAAVDDLCLAFEATDPSAAAALFVEDGRYFDKNGGEWVGRSGVADFVERVAPGISRCVRVGAVEASDDGSFVLAVEFTYNGIDYERDVAVTMTDGLIVSYRPI